MSRVLKADPTRTTAMRRRFMKDMATRMNNLRKAVWDLVVKQDAFGLIPTKHEHFVSGVVGNKAQYQFLADDKKLKAFQDWFDKQVQAGVLQVDPHNQQPWMDGYVESAYKKGAMRAYTDVHKEALAGDLPGYQGSKKQFLQDSFSLPVDVGRLRLLSMRAWENMKGLTATMKTQLSKQLADGFAHGKGPREIARKMDDAMDTMTRTRALVIARTEVIHAFAEGQLDSFDKLGVTELGVDAEWSTAGDDQVCPDCADLEGQVFTVEEARGMIPLHPNCRCAWIPASSDYKGKGKTKGAREEKKQEREQEISAPMPEFGDAQPTAIIRWMGQQGWTASDATNTMKNMGVEMAEATIRTQLRAGKKGERGEPAKLTEDMVRRLHEYRLGGVTLPPPPVVTPPPPPVVVRPPVLPPPVVPPPPVVVPPVVVPSFDEHSPTALVRWMGQQGWSFKEAKHAMTQIGKDVADATLRAQLGAGAKGQRGAPATPTADQIAHLAKLKSGHVGPLPVKPPVVVVPPVVPPPVPPPVVVPPVKPLPASTLVVPPVPPAPVSPLPKPPKMPKGKEAKKPDHITFTGTPTALTQDIWKLFHGVVGKTGNVDKLDEGHVTEAGRLVFQAALAGDPKLKQLHDEYKATDPKARPGGEEWRRMVRARDAYIQYSRQAFLPYLQQCRDFGGSVQFVLSTERSVATTLAKANPSKLTVYAVESRDEKGADIPGSANVSDGKKRAKLLEEQLRFVPADWIKGVRDQADGNVLGIGYKRRGQFVAQAKGFGKPVLYVGDTKESTTLHEFFHAAENAVATVKKGKQAWQQDVVKKRLGKLGCQFRKRRCSPGELPSDIYPGAGGAPEWGFQDKLNHRYAGRTYTFKAKKLTDATPQQARVMGHMEYPHTEIGSTGMEGLFYGTAEDKTVTDQDYLHFMLGMLAIA